MLDQEIIDLTRQPGTDSRNPISKNLPIEATVQNTEKDTKKQRKRKRRKSQNDTGGEITASNTRENSEERVNEGEEEDESRERRLVRRIHGDVTTGKDCKAPIEKSSDLAKNESSPSDNPNVDGLYIEDITPAPLPSNIAILPPPTFNNQHLPNDNSERTKLLLPAHVSVLGSTPVEILPADDSDEDEDKEYIKYLDYEIDRHVGQIFISFHCCTIEYKTRRSFCDILKNLRTNPLS
jgi:protein AIR1/2